MDSEWACSSCTFLNPPISAACQICLEARHSHSHNPPREIVALRWNCSVCTFANEKLGNCQMCGAERAADEEAPRLDSTFKPLRSTSMKRKVPDAASDSKENVASEESKPEKQQPNSLLKQLHTERISRQMVSDSSPALVESKEAVASVPQIVFLTYNVWFREDLEMRARMSAIGDLILQHQPHVICFQEVTPNIYNIFQESTWWGNYKCSVTPEFALKRAYFCIQLSKLPVAAFYRNPFQNSVMGRELCLADLNVGNNVQLVVATTHLESPCPAPPTWNQMYSSERVFQANEAIKLLKDFPNVIYGGDMNWDDKLDGPPPLEKGWFDSWLKLRPDQPGLTYDTRTNQMLTGNRTLQKRLDRIFCHLTDFDVESIDMVGTSPIAGLTYQKEKSIRKQKQLITLPVLPSDHYGLLLKLAKKIPVP